VSWALIRVDDRLVHGQVVVAWGGRLHPRRIVIADDPAAGSAWERDLLTTGAPGVEISVVTLAEAAALYAGEAAAEGAAFLVVRDLAGALELVRRGVRPDRINLGGLHYAAGKEKVNDYLYLDDADRAAVRELRAAGVALEVQDVPSTRPVKLAELGVEEAR